MRGHDWYYVQEHEDLKAGDWVRHTGEPGRRFKVHEIALSKWGKVRWVKVFGGTKGNEQYRFLLPKFLRKTTAPTGKVA